MILFRFRQLSHIILMNTFWYKSRDTKYCIVFLKFLLSYYQALMKSQLIRSYKLLVINNNAISIINKWWNKLKVIFFTWSRSFFLRSAASLFFSANSASAGEHSAISAGDELLPKLFSTSDKLGPWDGDKRSASLKKEKKIKIYKTEDRISYLNDS